MYVCMYVCIVSMYVCISVLYWYIGCNLGIWYWVSILILKNLPVEYHLRQYQPSYTRTSVPAGYGGKRKRKPQYKDQSGMLIKSWYLSNTHIYIYIYTLCCNFFLRRIIFLKWFSVFQSWLVRRIRPVLAGYWFFFITNGSVIIFLFLKMKQKFEYPMRLLVFWVITAGSMHKGAFLSIFRVIAIGYA